MNPNLRSALVASMPLVLALAPSAARALPAADTVPAGELEIVEHTVVQPDRGKDDKENYWLQLQIWGEMRNHSRRTVRGITADVTYFDAAGKPIEIQSIGTAAKKDAGDTTPGDRIDAAVHFVPPGASVPFHYTRNLAAIRGVVASHKLTLRAARAVDEAPVGVVTGLRESVAETTNPALPGSTTVARRRAFTGAIRNDGRTGCRDPKLVVAFLSPAGKLRDVRSFDAAIGGAAAKLVVAPGTSAPVSGAVTAAHDVAWRESAPVRTFVDCAP
jgi:hypothetical protein